MSAGGHAPCTKPQQVPAFDLALPAVSIRRHHCLEVWQPHHHQISLVRPGLLKLGKGSLQDHVLRAQVSLPICVTVLRLHEFLHCLGTGVSSCFLGCFLYAHGILHLVPEILVILPLISCVVSQVLGGVLLLGQNEVSIVN